MRRSFLLSLLFSAVTEAGVAVVDDVDRVVELEGPAARIVSLAPHVTELLFSAGAGANLVGAVQWSDYPEAAGRLPRVGDTHSLDMEAIVELQPDLVVAWLSGNGMANIERLLGLGTTIYVSEPASLERIAATIRDLGRLAGTDTAAAPAAEDFLDRLRKLRGRFSHRPRVSVFYQIWNQPLFTVNGRHLISEVITSCGGRNVFESLPALSPPVSVESVLRADPDVIIASGADATRPDWLEEWRRWTELKAVQSNRLFHIPPDLIQRHTARILDGATQMCAMLEQAREDRR